jgi:hypothetical protein
MSPPVDPNRPEAESGSMAGHGGTEMPSKLKANTILRKSGTGAAEGFRILSPIFGLSHLVIVDNPPHSLSPEWCVAQSNNINDSLNLVSTITPSHFCFHRSDQLINSYQHYLQDFARK